MIGTVVKRGLSTTVEYTIELLRTPWSLQENFRTPSLAQRSLTVHGFQQAHHLIFPTDNTYLTLTLLTQSLA